MAKLLLIDDEGIIRGALGAVLRQRGHAVFMAADGPAGLALLMKEAPDLVILDRDLPKMTGSAVLREIRKIDPKVAVIILTGNAAAQGEEKYRAMGISAFLSKDIAVEALIETVERLLPSKPMPKILIADDDPGVRSSLRRFLEGKGYRVETCADGREALASLKTFAPQLLLLDLEMPVLDGLETLRAMNQAGSKIPVIVITGDDDEDTARECLALGVSDYIVKPLNFDYLEVSVWAKIATALS